MLTVENTLSFIFHKTLPYGRSLRFQSAHFSNKQHTLHCTIAKPFVKQYIYNLSNDTKHDSIFVDHVLRDLIIHYNISNEDLWVQNDNIRIEIYIRSAY